MSFSQETQHTHTLHSALKMKLKKKGTPGLPVRTEVCFCVHKMRLYSYHILRKGGEVHKRGTEGGVECMSNRHIIPAGEHGQRIWGAARKGIKNKEANHEDAKTKKKTLEEWLNEKGSYLLVYIRSVEATAVFAKHEITDSQWECYGWTSNTVIYQSLFKCHS